LIRKSFTTCRQGFTDKKSHSIFIPDMKWQFHLTVFVKNFVALLIMMLAYLPMLFNISTSQEKPEGEDMWHKLCQCHVVTAML